MSNFCIIAVRGPEVRGGDSADDPPSSDGKKGKPVARGFWCRGGANAAPMGWFGGAVILGRLPGNSAVGGVAPKTGGAEAASARRMASAKAAFGAAVAVAVVAAVGAEPLKEGEGNGAEIPKGPVGGDGGGGAAELPPGKPGARVWI